MTPIAIRVPGIPQPGGSKRAFRNPHTGGIVVLDDNRKAAGWKERVALAARQAYAGEPLTCPLRVDVTFWAMRPRGHYGSGRNAERVKPSAPLMPATKPDATKLWRSTEDALTGIVWRDDAQIVTQVVRKRYGVGPGVEIQVREERE